MAPALEQGKREASWQSSQRGVKHDFHETAGKGVQSDLCEAGLLEGSHLSQVAFAANKAGEVLLRDFFVSEFFQPLSDLLLCSGLESARVGCSLLCIAFKEGFSQCGGLGFDAVPV